MTQSFLDMSYLFSCGARGIKPVLKNEIDIIQIYKLSNLQGIWQTVFLAIKQLYENNEIEIDKNIFEKIKTENLFLALQNTKRNIEIGKLLNDFEKRNIHYCILKGEVLAQLYHEPICRPSSDTDILIDKKTIKRALKCLSENGYVVKAKAKTSHHFVASHPIAGIVELHISLHDELFEDVWFDNKMLNIEPYRKIITKDNIELTTLGVTDGLIFVALHFIKHFLSKGVGIRQLMDVLLYMSYHKEQVDWTRFDNLMKNLKYDKFIEYTIGIGVRYLKLNQADFPNFSHDDNIVKKILCDMENGGVFGQNEEQRHDFYKIYTRERFYRFKHQNYEQYMNDWCKPTIKYILFPDIIYMSEKYNYIKRMPFLLPVAWVQRYFEFIIGIFKKQKNVDMYNFKQSNENNIVIEERLKLIRELDMI